ncbi:hypothetical protein B0T16DRAFT_510821 [Cercophora newfieldiana]|uniref:Uncharacterized protein n=1 Tax=Cercophora newfieldiana TaxID=92897 RepID=A0AA39Y5X6_9PEZI|nr:hypothetical protein B0T16DRAFT_510821 [Cercophora newfieldiana]
MLDDNLPTFRFKPSADNPLSSILYFTQNGADPAAEYVFRRADLAIPASRGRYAVALSDPVNPGVIYGEVLVEPEWVQPTLSAAEARAAQSVPATATVPGEFAVQLYNPDQVISVKMVPGGFAKSDSWEFEMPVTTFRRPSGSEIDKASLGKEEVDLVPRVMFRWKKEGRLSREMTCYMSGTSLGGRKNKEPDITVAMFKAGKGDGGSGSVLTVYEPNLHRVEVEDRKGLEVVLVLAAEVIKDLWVVPRGDVFNVQGGGAQPSRPVEPPKTSSSSMNATTPSSTAASASAGVDAETRRLQAMVEREEREREKREKAEQKRIKKMLDEEEKERRRQEAEIAKETERLRKKYGVEGQELPPLPPRPTNNNSAAAANAAPPPPQFYPPPTTAGAPALPPRPVSAGPAGRPSAPSSSTSNGPFHCSTLNAIWNGPGGGGWNLTPPPHLAAHFQGHQGGSPSLRPRREEDRKRVQKKRSSHW